MGQARELLSPEVTDAYKMALEGTVSHWDWFATKLRTICL
jgi:hypothetical protein